MQLKNADGVKSTPLLQPLRPLTGPPTVRCSPVATPKTARMTGDTVRLTLAEGGEAATRMINIGKSKTPIRSAVRFTQNGRNEGAEENDQHRVNTTSDPSRQTLHFYSPSSPTFTPHPLHHEEGVVGEIICRVWTTSAVDDQHGAYELHQFRGHAVVRKLAPLPPFRVYQRRIGRMDPLGPAEGGQTAAEQTTGGENAQLGKL